MLLHEATKPGDRDELVFLGDGFPRRRLDRFPRQWNDPTVVSDAMLRDLLAYARPESEIVRRLPTGAELSRDRLQRAIVAAARDDEVMSRVVTRRLARAVDDADQIRRELATPDVMGSSARAIRQELRAAVREFVRHEGAGSQELLDALSQILDDVSTIAPALRRVSALRTDILRWAVSARPDRADDPGLALP